MNYQYKQLTRSDVEAIEVLQQQVYDALEDKNILQPLSREELFNILNGNGLMIGVFDHEQCIAFRALLKPEVDEDEHLGVDVGATDLSRVLYQEISNVHPSYRGQNLQKQMAQYILQQVDLSAYDWMCATVMPFNIASLKDKFAQGMQIYALKLKYGGKLRYVFGKQLRQERFLETEKLEIMMADTKQQQLAIKQGYKGTDIVLKNDDWIVIFLK